LRVCRGIPQETPNQPPGNPLGRVIWLWRKKDNELKKVEKEDTKIINLLLFHNIRTNFLLYLKKS